MDFGTVLDVNFTDRSLSDQHWGGNVQSQIENEG